MQYLVIDTETSGLFDFSKPADAEGQPRLANLGMILLGDKFKHWAEWNLFVRPDGWTMNAEATKINGLITEYLMEHGLPLRDVLETYASMIDMPNTVVVAFNAQYDTKVMRGELRRAGMPDRFETTPNICLMRGSIGVCKIPRAKGNGYKFPKLEEACAHFKIPLPEHHGEMEPGTGCMSHVIATAELLRCLAHIGCLPEPEVHYAKERP
jgi:DNA polymerase-3 subunit epsilon